MRFPFTRLPSIDVFSVEDTVAQITWRGLPPGRLTATVETGPTRPAVELGEAGRPGAADLVGLAPDTDVVVAFAVDGQPVGRHHIRTQPALPGPALARIATISDLHLGETGFGLFKPMVEHDAAAPYPLRCALAAVREAEAWGAELIVIKGDITEGSRMHEWEDLDELLAAVHVPVLAVPGNHDTVGRPDSLDPIRELRRRGLFDAAVQIHEIAGARLVLADSTVPGHGYGRIARHRDALLEAVDVDRPVLLFAHHHFEDRPVPWFWPLGVQRFDHARLLRDLAAANPDLLISSGHTHRNRIRTEAGLRLTEVSSTKDHPGVWAGYVVHQTGVRQVTRRIAEPTAVAWTDRTHAVVGGVWGRWSPGSIDDRSLTHHWTRTRPMPVGNRSEQQA